MYRSIFKYSIIYSNTVYKLEELFNTATVTAVSPNDAEPWSVWQVYQVHGHTLTRLQLAAGRSPAIPTPCSSGTQVAGQGIAAAHSAAAECL